MTKDQGSPVAFLIDADNLSATAVEQAFEHLARSGASVSVRRAYGGHEKLTGMKDVLKRFAVRSFVNHGKGTTDVALVVDAMDLLHGAALPATVAIGSSDADFAPLAVRLREAGRRVLCFGQRDKSAVDDLALAYDEVVCFGTNQHVDVPPTVPAKPAPASLRAARPAKTASGDAPAVLMDDPTAARRILAALPEWLPDTVRQLNQIGTALRESGISKGNKPLHELFRKHPSYFKVLPITGQAKQIRLLRKP